MNIVIPIEDRIYESGIVNKERARVRCYALMAAWDIFALTAAFALSSIAMRFFMGGSLLVDQARTLLTALTPLYLLQAALSNAYGVEAIERSQVSVTRAVRALIITAAYALFVGYFIKASAEFSRSLFISGIVIGAVIISIGRVSISKYMTRRLGGSAHMVVVLSDNIAYKPVSTEVVISTAELGFSPEVADPYHFHLLAKTVAHADRLLVATTAERAASWASVLRSLNLDGEIFTDLHDHLRPVGLRKFGDHRTIVIATGPLGIKARALKRGFDIVVSCVGLVLCFPVLIAVAIAIRCESAGPVFFRQERVGRDNKIFRIYKFRSMYIDLCDANASRLTEDGDNRVTRIGRLIRRNSIDEIPQLLNVLRGEMSIVGPRPHALAAKAADMLYWDADLRYRQRHSVKPGLTGLAQVRGHRGNTHMVEDLVARVQSDLEYTANWSLQLDIVIMIQTLGVLRDKNAY